MQRTFLVHFLKNDALEINRLAFLLLYIAIALAECKYTLAENI